MSAIRPTFDSAGVAAYDLPPFERALAQAEARLGGTDDAARMPPPPFDGHAARGAETAWGQSPGVQAARASSAPYTVLHGQDSLQLATDRLVIPASELAAFNSAVACAQALEGLLQGAQARVESEARQAREAGFVQGHQEARQAGSDQLVQAIERMVEAFQAQQAAQRDAVGTLALAVVSKLAAAIGAERMVPALIEQAVLELLPHKLTRVRVCPEMLAPTRARLEALGVTAEVRGDESLGSFHCVVDSADGQHVASLEHQLAAVGKALGAALPVDVEL